MERVLSRLSDSHFTEQHAQPHDIEFHEYVHPNLAGYFSDIVAMYSILISLYLTIIAGT